MPSLLFVLKDLCSLSLPFNLHSHCYDLGPWVTQIIKTIMATTSMDMNKITQHIAGHNPQQP